MSKKKKVKNYGELQPYIDFVNDNNEVFVQCINEAFDREKDNIGNQLLEEIRMMLTPMPTHYEWVNKNDSPYDHSGTVIPSRSISKDQTVQEFLEDEYTGQHIPSFCSGCGWNWETFGDVLEDVVLDYGYKLMMDTIKSVLEKQFSVSLSDEDLSAIKEDCYEFDNVFDGSDTVDFSTWEDAVDFTGIGDMLLSDILKEQKKETDSLALYIDFVNENKEDFVNCVNEAFEKEKDQIKTNLLTAIRRILINKPEHYTWSEQSASPCRIEGTMIQQGNISLNQTVEDFFENEYTGEFRASYNSAKTFSWDTYGDYISNDTMVYGENLMLDVIKKVLDAKFSVLLSEEDMLEIRNGCNDFEEIYNTSYTIDFSSWEKVVEFVNIGNILLSDILQDEK